MYVKNSKESNSNEGWHLISIEEQSKPPGVP
jgi:hypothetical protein